MSVEPATYAAWSRKELEQGIDRVEAEIVALEDQVAVIKEVRRQTLIERIAEVKARLAELGAEEVESHVGGDSETEPDGHDAYEDDKLVQGEDDGMSIPDTDSEASGPISLRRKYGRKQLIVTLPVATKE